MANDFQHYFRLWEASFPQRREVRWANGYLHNAYCADCRYCCGPQDSATPFPMPLLPAQCHERLEDDFYLLDPVTPCLDDRGCKSCGPQGCRLPRPQRPIACGLFPLVLVRDALHLYQCCPAALHLPLRDGDTERDDDNYAGCYFINANSKTAPQIVDKRVRPILDRSEVYSGVYAIVSLSFYAFNTNGNRGVACGLGNIQKVRDGEPLGGRTNAASEFETLDDEDFLS